MKLAARTKWRCYKFSHPFRVPRAVSKSSMQMVHAVAKAKQLALLYEDAFIIKRGDDMDEVVMFGELLKALIKENGMTSLSFIVD